MNRSKIFTPLLIFLIVVSAGCKKEIDDLADSNTSMRFLIESGIEKIRHSIPTSDGGIIHVGDNGNQAFMMKLSESGQKEWFRDFGGTGRESFLAVAEMSNGDFVAVGSSTSPGPGVQNSNSSPYVVRVSSNGMEKWDSTFAISSQSGLTCVKEDHLGNIVTAGFIASSSSTTLVLKLTGQGAIDYGYTYQIGDWHDMAKQITFTQDNDYIIWGIQSPSNYIIEIRKYLPYRLVISSVDGNYAGSQPMISYFSLQSEEKIANAGDDFLGIREIGNGNVMMVFEARDWDESRYSKIAVIDASGDPLKRDNLFVHENFSPKNLALGNGELLLTGRSSPNDLEFSNQSVIRLVSLDLNGSVQWEQEFGDNYTSQVGTISVPVSGDIAVSGQISDVESGKSKFLFYKTSKSGEIK